jgi:molybdopterin-containing oxidoreductase family iron-sulfur binding subunit
MKRGPLDDDVRDSRRKLLAGLAASAAGALAGCTRAMAAQSTAPVAATSGSRRRWGLVIDLDRCARCGGCVVACQQENNVAPAGSDAAARMRPIHWMDFLPAAPGSSSATPIPCMHCEDPPCVKVCPVGATYKTEEGITAQIWERCIGCRYCMVACPYARRYFNWSEPRWPGDVSSLNPDVAPRPRGVVEKCTLCHHRIRAALERARVDEEPLTDETLRRLPACAQSCPTLAITFGDLADPESEVARLAASPRAVRLLPEAGTRPKVIYLRETK